MGTPPTVNSPDTITNAQTQASKWLQTGDVDKAKKELKTALVAVLKDDISDDEHYAANQMAGVLSGGPLAADAKAFAAKVNKAYGDGSKAEKANGRQRAGEVEKEAFQSGVDIAQGIADSPSMKDLFNSMHPHEKKMFTDSMNESARSLSINDEIVGGGILDRDHRKMITFDNNSFSSNLDGISRLLNDEMPYFDDPAVHQFFAKDFSLLFAESSRDTGAKLSNAVQHRDLAKAFDALKAANSRLASGHMGREEAWNVIAQLPQAAALAKTSTSQDVLAFLQSVLVFIITANGLFGDGDKMFDTNLAEHIQSQIKELRPKLDDKVKDDDARNALALVKLGIAETASLDWGVKRKLFTRADVDKAIKDAGSDVSSDIAPAVSGLFDSKWLLASLSEGYASADSPETKRRIDDGIKNKSFTRPQVDAAIKAGKTGQANTIFSLVGYGDADPASPENKAKLQYGLDNKLFTQPELDDATKKGQIATAKVRLANVKDGDVSPDDDEAKRVLQFGLDNKVFTKTELNDAIKAGKTANAKTRLEEIGFGDVKLEDPAVNTDVQWGLDNKVIQKKDVEKAVSDGRIANANESLSELADGIVKRDDERTAQNLKWGVDHKVFTQLEVDRAERDGKIANTRDDN